MDDKRKGFIKIRSHYFKIHPEVCNRCYSPNDIELHHKKPVIEGGTHEFDNLIPLCRKCHMEWHNRYSGWMRFSEFLETFADWENTVIYKKYLSDPFSILEDPDKWKNFFKEERQARKKEILLNPLVKPKNKHRTFEYDNGMSIYKRRKKVLYELRGNKWHLIQW